jgi:hypothetical protein
MISAKDARILVQQSEKNIKDHCDRIGKKIEEASSLGISKLVLDNAFPHTPEYRINVGVYAYRTPDLTPFQKTLKAELEKYEYMVKVVKVDHDGRGGLGVCDEDPEPFSTYHIQVSW